MPVVYGGDDGRAQVVVNLRWRDFRAGMQKGAMHEFVNRLCGQCRA